VRIDRRAVARAEHIVAVRVAAFGLLLQGIAHHRQHRDVAQGRLGLGVGLGGAGGEGLAHAQEAGFEVDVLPLQAIDLAGAQAGEETHGDVVAEILADRRADRLDFDESERLHVQSSRLEAADAAEGIGQAESLAGLAEDLAQQAHDLVDRGRRQSISGPAGPRSQPGAEGQHLRLVDRCQRASPERRQQMGREEGIDAAAMRRAPLRRHLGAPRDRERGEGRHGDRRRRHRDVR